MQFNLRFLFVHQLRFAFSKSSCVALLSWFILACNSNSARKHTTESPATFVYIQQIIPDVLYDIRYAGKHNFIGKPINGYKKSIAMLSAPAADSLKKVQNYLKTRGYRIKIFDAYRPQRAVNHFIKWAKATDDTLMKREFYPQIDKKDLFKLGYIAAKSGHTRGSTVDLTIVDIATGKEVDMGSPFDFFGNISHHGSHEINAEQESHRLILKEAMLRFGFKPLPEEWWHYTLVDEPYPTTYFDFEVK
ncbi:MAG TPA: M15 family metallopeptidase [Pseudosphingobacterium sp.]|nr:M15 family metallopeptidase [Pseudosphingobacterium sp.]